MLVVDDADPFDPRLWKEVDYEYRIYGDDSLETYAIVDERDYHALAAYRWSIHTVKRGYRRTDPRSNQLRKKVYLRRGISTFYDSDGEKYEHPITGKLVRNRRRTQSNEFLHQAVMRRMGLEPPTPKHKIIDHIDRDTLNCRRSNLRWATHSENTKNCDKLIAYYEKISNNGGARDEQLAQVLCES